MMAHPITISILFRKLSPLILGIILFVFSSCTSSGGVNDQPSSSTTVTPTIIPPSPTPVDIPTGTSPPPLLTATNPQSSVSPLPPIANIFPVVIYPPYESRAGYLLGGTMNGIWQDSFEIARLLHGGEQYWLYSDKEEMGLGFGSAPLQNPPFCPNWYEVALDPQPTSPSMVAVGGNWNALPRIPQEMSTDNDTYRKAVGELLQDNGLPSSDIQITRLLRIDLEGDGMDEVVMSAAHFDEETGHEVVAGDYSVIAIRTITPDGVKTLSLVADYYFADNELAFPNRYELVGILDINGDGRMEIIVQIRGWEKLGTLGYVVQGETVEDLFDVHCP